jgi:hypothetical protein
MMQPIRVYYDAADLSLLSAAAQSLWQTEMQPIRVYYDAADLSLLSAALQSL